MSIDKLYLYEYTLCTELGVRKFISECNLSEEDKMKMEKEIESALAGAYYVPDIVHTVSDLLCKVYEVEESGEILTDIAKRSLLKGNVKRRYEGCLEKIDRKALLYALLDFIEQECGSLNEFIQVWEESYIHRLK